MNISDVLIDSVGIQELIPHRYPFLLVDRVTEVDLWSSAVGFKCFSINEMFFQGHFPGKPVVPGVLLVEGMAQVAVICIAYSCKQERKPIPDGVAFMKIEDARFRAPVVPGDRIKFVVEKDVQKGKIWKFIGKGYVEDKLVCESKFIATVV